MRRCLKRATDAGSRLFRNNIARAWVGNRVTRFTGPQRIAVQAGDVLVHDARPLHAGLAEGSGDLIGWTRITITPDMVGQTVAIFTSAEIKALRGRATAGQIAWADAVSGAGGLAAIVRTDGDLDNLLRGGGIATQHVDKGQE